MIAPLTVLTESSLIARTEETLLLQSPIFIGAVFGSMILVFILSIFPPRIISGAQTGIYCSAIALFVTLTVVGFHNFKSVGEELNTETRSNISEKLNQKYGIEVVSESDIPTTLANGSATVGDKPVPAKNPEGERIQINVELVNNKTDVLAFSAGSELKRIDG